MAVNKYFFYGMIFIFALTYHLTKITSNQHSAYKITTIDCTNIQTLKDFYNTYLNNVFLTPEETEQLDLNSLAEYFKSLKLPSPQKRIFFAITINNECAGFASLIYNIPAPMYQEQDIKLSGLSLIEQYDWGILDIILIFKKHRSQGFGKILLQHISRAMHEINIPTLYVVVKKNNHIAQKLYHSLDLQYTDPIVEKVPISSKIFETSFLMRKDLN